MIAVIETGGKQYTVSKGQKVLVEKLEGNPGDQIAFSNVLLLKDQAGGIQVGAPVIQGATVVGELVRQTRGEKVIIFKKKRRHNYRRKLGHRQDLTLVEVSHIALPGEKVEPKKASPARSPAETKPKESPSVAAKATKEAKAIKTEPKETSAKAPLKKEATKASPKKETAKSAKVSDTSKKE